MESSDTSTEGTAARTEKASFGAGCFWQPEMAFRDLDGVIDTAVGYEGGHVDNPTLRAGLHRDHRPRRGDAGDLRPRAGLLRGAGRGFWHMHDPTQVDRQGPDVGIQYRSVIFTNGPEQEAVAKASKERAQERFSEPIATSIEPATGFWRAEEYHQCYLQKRQGGLSGMLRSALGS